MTITRIFSFLDDSSHTTVMHFDIPSLNKGCKIFSIVIGAYSLPFPIVSFYYNFLCFKIIDPSLKCYAAFPKYLAKLAGSVRIPILKPVTPI